MLFIKFLPHFAIITERTKTQDPRPETLDPGSRIQKPGLKTHDPGSRNQDQPQDPVLKLRLYIAYCLLSITSNPCHMEIIITNNIDININNFM